MYQLIIPKLRHRKSTIEKRNFWEIAVDADERWIQWNVCQNIYKHYYVCNVNTQMISFNSIINISGYIFETINDFQIFKWILMRKY